jgi:hypothetical protein
MPTDFPVGYVLSATGQHQLYVLATRWGVLRDFWEMGCLKSDCEQRIGGGSPEARDVCNWSDLERWLLGGHIVGVLRDGVVHCAGAAWIAGRKAE